MKNLLLSFALIGVAPLTVSAQTSEPASQDNPDIAIAGSAITGSETYTFSTANDLLLNAAPTSDPTYDGSTDGSAWTRDHDGSGGVPALTDATYGGNPQRGTTATGGSSGGLSVTYTLGSGLAGGANPLGYDLTDIEVYSGWNDTGRYTQGYTVSVELLDGTWDELSAVSQFPSHTVFAANAALPSAEQFNGAETDLTPTMGLYLPTDGAVKAIEFDFTTPSDPDGNNYVGYAELVVNGTAAPTPEPGTYALVGLGLASLLVVVRARRSVQA